MSNLRAPIKEEFPGGMSSSSNASGCGSNITIPQPMESLQDPGPPPFLTKTYEIVDDPTTDHIVSWSTGNNSFVVWDSQTFSMTLLPKYFKHNNFSSFIRQLNTYGFKKVDPDRWEFANEGFLRGQTHLLKNIRRRKSSNPTLASSSQQSVEPCVEVGIFGLDQEIERLKRDKQVLMMELIKLRQQQQTSKAYLRQMEQRLERTERKQQQMMSFLAKAMKNPEFMQQVLQQNDRRKKLEEAINKKRRRRINQADFSDNSIDICNAVGSVPASLEDVSDLGVDGIDMLPTEIIKETVNEESYLGELEEDEHEDAQHGRVDRGVDDRFWRGLLNDGHEELGFLGLHVGNEDGVHVLDEQLRYLASSPK